MRALLRIVVPMFLIAVAAPVSAVGCSSTQDDEIEGDEAAVTAGTCEVFSAVSKKKLTKDELSALKDPVAQKLLLGEGCPENFNEVTAKLGKTDAKGCEKNEGVSTRLVNDSAFLTGKSDGSYRGVITRDCDGRGNHDFFVSVFGISPGSDKLPQEQTELVGMDRTSGVFNLYVRESKEKRWVFMGSSKDAVSNGYTCNDNGSCIPNTAKDARCWACHEGGGINMKELNSPWDSWNLGSGMPGNDEIFKKFGKQLGQSETGIDLEGRVSSGNAVWNKKRIEILKEKGAAEVLRPLFCTLTVNLQAAGGAGSLSRIPGGFFVGDRFRGSVTVDNNDYQALLKANGQQVTDGQRQLSGKNGPILDTQNAFRYIEKGDVDNNYIRQLIAAKIIDEDFEKDVLSIDMTRPVFSKTRCDLLSAAPDLKGADLTADKIRAGFIKELGSATGAGAELLKSLQDTADAATHQKDADAFFAACAARPKKDLLADSLLVLSHTRRALLEHKGTEGAGRGQGIIEFPETLPVDKLPDTNKAFDLATCTLK
jgi:hypothetical protein